MSCPTDGRDQNQNLVKDPVLKCAVHFTSTEEKHNWREWRLTGSAVQNTSSCLNWPDACRNLFRSLPATCAHTFLAEHQRPRCATRKLLDTEWCLARPVPLIVTHETVSKISIKFMGRYETNLNLKFIFRSLSDCWLNRFWEGEFFQVQPTR